MAVSFQYGGIRQVREVGGKRAAPVIEALARALEATPGDEMVAQHRATDSVIAPLEAEAGPAAALIRAEHARWGQFIRAARTE